MPNIGPVYQPTTVSYEQQGEWRNPSTLLTQTNTSVRRVNILQWLTLVLSVSVFVSGLTLLIIRSIKISKSEVVTSDVFILIIGCILLVMGCVLISFFIGQKSCPSGCPGFLLKEKGIAHQMRDNQSVNGQAINPSTDFLVTAQYAPVSEIAYQPQAVPEEEETRKLMGSDNKDCNDDSERILDKDPRIVLRPLSKVEEFHDSEMGAKSSNRMNVRHTMFQDLASVRKSLLKESNSIITLNPEKFEAEDSPEPRRQNRFGVTRSGGNANHFSTGDKPLSSKTWKDSILRKASVRSKKAPLAGFEELSPSLRSSWSSMYFRTSSESESEGEGVSYNSDE